MDFSINIKSWISALRESAWRLTPVLVAGLLLTACLSCGYGQEDVSAEGKQAIRSVQIYKTPLSDTVSSAVMNYIYRCEFDGEKIVRDDWYAIKSFYADGISIGKKYHVVYRFIQYRKHKEISFVYYPKTGKVLAANKQARELTGLPGL